jgi:hypothetical protein
MNQYRFPEELDKATPQQAKSTKAVVEDELVALDAVITEAEQKRRDPYLRGYEEVYRHGFGKTVVIDTELKGRLTYRITLVSGDYANTRLGISSPNTLIGNLCRSARLGLVRESDEWGEFTIVEIRNFTRYAGQEAAEHIRNFRVMESQVLEASSTTSPVQVTVSNLRAALGRWVAKKSQSKDAMSSQEASADSVQQSQHPVIPDFEFDFDFDEPVILVETEEEQTNHYDIFGRSDEEQDDYYGLSTYFFLNPTDEQLAIMTNSPSVGPMLVEGVAGSGKTCAALGRAKTLCDLARSPDDEQFNSDFLAESSIGFVRTGELVQYLRASCLELDISKLPIEEYAGLVYQMSLTRNLFIEKRKSNSAVVRHTTELDIDDDVDDSDDEGGVITIDGELTTPDDLSTTKYRNQTELPFYDFWQETRISWLQTVSSIIGWKIADDLQQQLASLAIPDNVKNDSFIAKNNNGNMLLSLVINRLNRLYQPIISQLRGQSSAPFALDRIISQILAAQGTLTLELFDKKAKWVNPAAGEWHGVRDAKGAVELLRSHGVVLAGYDRTNKVWTDVVVAEKADLHNLFNQGASLFIRDESDLLQVTDLDKIWSQLVDGDIQIHCRFSTESPMPVVLVHEFDDINMRLLNHNLLARSGKRVFQIIEANPFCRQITAGQKLTSLERVLRRSLRRIFSKWQFAELYRDALLHPYADDPDKATSVMTDFPHWPHIAERLKGRMLAEHDKDLLLAIAHVMTRGAGQAATVPAHLVEQTYYRSVFVDEVQDFTEQQIFLMAEQADPKYHAVTLVGDMHQQLGRGNVQNIEACFPYRPLTRYLLKENKRQERQPQLAASAMLFRALVQQDSRLQEPETLAVWREQALSGVEKQFYHQPFDSLDRPLLDVIRRQPHGRTIAVVCPTLQLAAGLEARLRQPLMAETARSGHVAERIELAKKYVVHFSCAENVKGLEFDTVIFAGIEHIDWDDAHQLNKTYVTLSRPRKQLVMFGDETRLPDMVRSCLLPARAQIGETC